MFIYAQIHQICMFNNFSNMITYTVLNIGSPYAFIFTQRAFLRG